MKEEDQNDIFIIQVSGLIGAGKSTFLKKLQETTVLNVLLGDDIDTCFFLEPSDLWDQNQWLQRFYKYQEQLRLAFQMLVYHTHIQGTQKAIAAAKKPGRPLVVISERGIHDQALFWKAQLKKTDGDEIEPMLDEAYQAIWKCHNVLIPPTSAVVYLTTSVEVAMQRKDQRERGQLKDSMIDLSSSTSSSSGPTAEYQELLKQLHDSTYTAGKCLENPSIPCLHLDVTDEPYHRSDGSLVRVARQLSDFIKAHVLP